MNETVSYFLTVWFKAAHLCPACFSWPLANRTSTALLPAKCQPAPAWGLPLHQVSHPFLSPGPPPPSGEAHASLLKNNALNA